MALVSSITVMNSSTNKPISQNSPISSTPILSSPQSPLRQPTKIILPNKRPMKWSTSVGPGEYGGPPPTTKLRKYWGGEKEDPVTSSVFIWNNDFMPQLEKLVQDPKLLAPVQDGSPPVEESSGFLSLNRVRSLDSLEADLSASLIATPKPGLEQQHTTTEVTTGNPTRKWRPAPTKREQEKWDRATKAATAGSNMMLRETRQPRGDPEVLAAQSREQYCKLKNKLQLMTLGIGSVGLVSAYVSYSPEIAASFGAGFLGSLAYIRMLGSSIDSMASSGAKKVMKGAIGQPRLLVPVALVMIFNRWNEIAVPQYGLVHLELIPMLVGFFTYKIATFAQAIGDALPAVVKKSVQY